MKALYLSILFIFLSLSVKAQADMSLLFEGFFPLPYNGTFDATAVNVPQGTVHTFNFTIKNTGTSDLILSQTGGVYVVLSGTGAPEVVSDESGITSATIAPNGTVTFSVTSKSTTAPGDYTLTLSIANNTAAKNPYVGSITYRISPATSTLSAEEAGISISPNPSTDGRININGNVIVDKVIVYGLNGTSEEFAGAASFHTRQKGLLIVHVYTNRGIVAEKIRVQ
jgi:hypothetical protein